MAEQLATAMQLRGLSKVGVAEFIVDMRTREVLGGEYGSLGRYCAVELQGRLMNRSAGKFDVVEHDALQEELRTKGFTVKDVRTSAIKDLTVEGKSMPVIALGTLRNRVGSKVTMQCKLVGIEDQTVFGVAGGTAKLNESEWTMLGRSAVAPIPEAPTPEHPVPAHVADPIPPLDRESDRPPPPVSPDFPYRVKIMVQGQERELVVRGNDLFVALAKDEVFRVRVEYAAEQLVFMRLLVDGRNTVPQKVAAKGVKVEPITAEDEYRPPRVNLYEARPWVLNPERGPVWEIRGFFSDLGDAKRGKPGTYHQFKVVEAPGSLAATDRFSAEPGLITVAFFAPKGSSRGMFVVPGPEEKQKIRMYHKPPKVGNLLAVVNIHYVGPEALDKLLEEKRPPSTE